MNFNNDNEMWNWEVEDSVLEDNSGIGDISRSLLDELNQDANYPISLDDATTPVNACGDLAYHVNNNEAMGKEMEHHREPSSQAKRRRLQFEEEAPIFNDEMFLRSKETQDSLGDALSDMPHWVPEYAGASATNNEYLDPSAEVWIAECFNDVEMQFNTEDLSNASGASDIQIDITELCDTPPEHDVNAVEKLPVRTTRNVAFKGRKSYMRTPPKLASSVVYPFTFIKPCGLHGDTTLKDINRRIHTPPKLKQNEQESVCQTSAFSGKPVVGKTKIRTEGGEGSITIVRTKG